MTIQLTEPKNSYEIFALPTVHHYLKVLFGLDPEDSQITGRFGIGANATLNIDVFDPTGELIRHADVTNSAVEGEITVKLLHDQASCGNALDQLSCGAVQDLKARWLAVLNAPQNVSYDLALTWDRHYNSLTITFCPFL